MKANGIQAQNESILGHLEQQRQEAEKSQYVNTFIAMDEGIENGPEVQHLIDEYKQCAIERARSRSASPKSAAKAGMGKI